jgi:uncharacterized protein YodC (DUF2158 family)
MADEFKVGDTVRLKSGGPIMTIQDIGEGLASCIWFERTKREGGSFVIATLEHAERMNPGVGVAVFRS